MALEDGNDRQLPKRRKSKLRNITEERRSQIRHGGKTEIMQVTDRSEELRVDVRIILKWVYKS